jgi:hypothetical protein
MRKALEVRWRKTVEAQSKYYNKKRVSMVYAVNDLVMLSAKNIKTKRPSKKLDLKFYGPYRIVEAVSTHAYRLDIKGSKIHPVFHVSLLEPYIRREGAENAQPPPIEDFSEDEWEVKEVLAKRETKKKGVEYLIKWLGYDDAENSWEPAEYAQRAPDLVKRFEEQEQRRSRAKEALRSEKGRKRRRQ